MQLVIDVALFLIYFGAFLLLLAWSWRFWMMHVNQKHLHELNWIMLEIKLPREILKSPLATEVAIASFMQTGGISKTYHRNYKGGLPAFGSLEIASIEGIIHFYVRVQKKYRPLMESSFYAQYPGIEIVEADDYTKLIRYNHLSKEVSAWGAAYTLSESWTPKDLEKTGEAYKDPESKDDFKLKADFLPIKTYVDFGLDRDPKDEFKIDPLNHLLEFMGSIGKGEYFWYQVILQDESVYNDKKMPKFYVNPAIPKHFTLKEMAEDYKKVLRTSKFIKKGTVAKDEYGYTQKFPAKEGEEAKEKMYQDNVVVPKKEMELTIEEKDRIEAANRKLSKPLILGIIRLLYITKGDAFNTAHIQNILAFPKSFAGVNSFGLKPTDPYDYPWQNFRDHRVPWRTEEMFEEYVEREGFFPHIPERKQLDKWEDQAFWSYPMKVRKMVRLVYEAIFHPFAHPHPTVVSTYNLEEIATLWHLPGASATTPSIPRIDSAKGFAPTNLPH